MGGPGLCMRLNYFPDPIRRFIGPGNVKDVSLMRIYPSAWLAWQVVI